MANTLTLLNNVLRGLRKTTLSTGTSALSDEYHKLVLQFLDTAKSEVEESWDWQGLRTTVTVTAAASDDTLELTAAADADVDVPHTARLLYEREGAGGVGTETSIRTFGAQPQVFDVTDSSEYRLEEVTPERIERWRLTDDDQTVTRPASFALVRDADSVFLHLYPAPTAERTLKLRFVIPQDALADDSLDVVLTVPERPVWARALFYANEERGEELSRPNSSLDRQAMDALADAIAREQTDADVTGLPE